MFYRIDPAAITTVSAWDAFRSHRLPDFASIERSLEQTGWKLVSLTLQKLHAHEIGTSRRFRRIVMAKNKEAEILAGLQRGGETRDAPLREGQSEKRQGWKGRHGEEPQTGNCHRALQGAQEGQESAKEKEIEVVGLLLYSTRNRDEPTHQRAI
jgi:hypothetical protein